MYRARVIFDYNTSFFIFYKIVIALKIHLNTIFDIFLKIKKFRMKELKDNNMKNLENKKY